MKKIIVILFLLLISTPLYVSATAYIPYPDGFIVGFKDCENGNSEDFKDLYIDILFEKEAIDPNLISPVINDLYINEMSNSNIESSADYLSLDNDWISFTAYFTVRDYPTENWGCSVIFNQEEYIDLANFGITEFKVVVLNDVGDVISISNEISTDIMLNHDTYEYKKVMYDVDEEYFYLYPVTIDPDDYGPQPMFSPWGVVLIYAIIIVVLIVLFFSETLIFFFAKQRKTALISLIFNGLVGLLVFLLVSEWIFKNHDYWVWAFLLSDLLILGLMIWKLILIKKDYYDLFKISLVFSFVLYVSIVMVLSLLI